VPPSPEHQIQMLSHAPICFLTERQGKIRPEQMSHAQSRTSILSALCSMGD
jgi:hypothetical protein